MIKSTKLLSGITGLIAASLIALSPSVSGLDAPVALMDYSDIFGLEYAASPRISPDGKHVTYERRSQDVMSDSTRTNIWQVALDGTDHRPLLSGKANYRMPRYSKDGKRLAYISSIEGKNQLYVRWLDTAQTARVTDLHYAPSSVSWSPDGKWLAFSMFVKSKDKTLFKDMPAKPKGAKWAGTAKYIDRTSYRSNGAGFLPRGFSHIFVVPADGGSPRQITSGDFHHRGTINWTADSASVIISADRNKDWENRPGESDLYSVNVTTGATENLTNREGRDGGAAISPDGTKIAYVRVEERLMPSQNGHLIVMNLDGTDLVDLTPDLDRDVGGIQWASDGKGLYFQYANNGQGQAAYVNLSGNRRVITGKLGGQSLGRPYTSGEFRALNDGRIVFTLSKTDRPADLAIVDRIGRVTQLTRLNEDLLAHKTLAAVKEMTVKSSVDGRDLHAWVAVPPGFDASKKYPLILEIHGGPHTAYGPNFTAEIQLMAAKGYVVVWGNPRGSTSYGEEFANLIQNNYPNQDYNDLMDMVDGVIEQGYVDKDQLYVTGGSGGGVLTAWIVGKTDRFRAAVVAKPVINWISFTLTSDMTAYAAKYWFPGKPWDHFEHYWKRSPLSLVGNVTTPTMLLTGEVDYRTPISETEQYYQALKLQKVDTAMVRIAKANHGIASHPSNLIQKVGNIMAWFDKYKK